MPPVTKTNKEDRSFCIKRLFSLWILNYPTKATLLSEESAQMNILSRCWQWLSYKSVSYVLRLQCTFSLMSSAIKPPCWTGKTTYQRNVNFSWSKELTNELLYKTPRNYFAMIWSNIKVSLTKCEIFNFSYILHELKYFS